MTAVAARVDLELDQAEATTVYSFRKNSREEVRARLTTFKGHELADLRVYVENDAGDAIATRKGLCISVQHLAALRDAVDALLEAAA